MSYLLTHLIDGKNLSAPDTPSRREKYWHLRHYTGPYASLDIQIALSHTGEDTEAAHILLKDAYGR